MWKRIYVRNIDHNVMRICGKDRIGELPVVTRSEFDNAWKFLDDNEATGIDSLPAEMLKIWGKYEGTFSK